MWGQCGENPEIKNRLTCYYQQIKRFLQYPEPGSNRHGHYWPQDFKSGVSTDSTIRAHSFSERCPQKYENICDLQKSRLLNAFPKQYIPELRRRHRAETSGFPDHDETT